MQAVFAGSKYGIGHRGPRGRSRDCSGHHDANGCADLATPIVHQLLTITMTDSFMTHWRAVTIHPVEVWVGSSGGLGSTFTNQL